MQTLIVHQPTSEEAVKALLRLQPATLTSTPQCPPSP
jgi:hypothetical protein